MEVIRLRESFKCELKRISLFFMAGLINTALDCSLYYILINFLSPARAQPIALTAGLVSSFLINRKYTFKSNKKIFSVELLKYIIISAVSIIISPVLIAYFDFRSNEFLAKIPVTIITGVFNYILCRFWVYRSINTDTADKLFTQRL